MLSYIKSGGEALKSLSENPKYSGLHLHPISSLSERYGMKVWEAYLENNNSEARRMFWVYGPNREDITIIGLDPHSESSKNGAYDNPLFRYCWTAASLTS